MIHATPVAPAQGGRVVSRECKLVPELAHVYACHTVGTQSVMVRAVYRAGKLRVTFFGMTA